MIQTGLTFQTKSDSVQTVSVALETLGVVSPFNRLFYSELDNIKILKRDRFEAIKESIIDIQSSFTVYQGTYKEEPIIVKEIFERFTSVRQWMSIINGKLNS